MRSLIQSLFIFGLAAVANPQSHAQSQFVISCRANLTGVQGQLALPQVFSNYFTLSAVDFANSQCAVLLGDHKLTSRMSMTGGVLGSDYEPTLWIELFKGNPVQGGLNNIFVQGLDLQNWPLHKEQTFSGIKFLQATVEGRGYSRIDYTCSLTRVL